MVEGKEVMGEIGEGKIPLMFGLSTRFQGGGRVVVGKVGAGDCTARSYFLNFPQCHWSARSNIHGHPTGQISEKYVPHPSIDRREGGFEIIVQSTTTTTFSSSTARRCRCVTTASKVPTEQVVIVIICCCCGFTVIRRSKLVCVFA